MELKRCAVLAVLAVFLMLNPFMVQYADSSDEMILSRIEYEVITENPGLVPFHDLQYFDEIPPRHTLYADYMKSDLEGIFHPKEILDYGRYQPLANDSVGITLLVLGTVGVLWLAPESISKWDEDEKEIDINKLKRRWKDHTRDGPVWDNDEWWINYIGHPYFGAGYYCHTRHMELSRLESFAYATFMSTSLYEYGFEAFFEIPSTQDLIFTPIGGVLMGELFLLAERRIKKNKNRVLGSLRLGNFCRSMMDPVGYSLKHFRGLNDEYSKIAYRSRYYTEQRTTPKHGPEYGFEKDYRYGFEIIVYRK